MPQAGHVVDDCGARLQGRARDAGLHRVDAQRDLRPAGIELLDERDDPLDLEIRIERPGTGPRRLAADVEDGRPVQDQLLGAGESGGGRRMTPAVEERIGSDVEDTDDQWPGNGQTTPGG